MAKIIIEVEVEDDAAPLMKLVLNRGPRILNSFGSMGILSDYVSAYGGDLNVASDRFLRDYIGQPASWPWRRNGNVLNVRVVEVVDADG